MKGFLGEAGHETPDRLSFTSLVKPRHVLVLRLFTALRVPVHLRQDPQDGMLGRQDVLLRPVTAVHATELDSFQDRHL